jgi:hypothetical protein
MRFMRITIDPRQMGGVPCIRGLRIPVATVVGMIADSMAEAEILAAYPDLECVRRCATPPMPRASGHCLSLSREISGRQCVIADPR